MKLAHAIALASIPFLTVAGAVAATWSQRVRDVFFFAMVSLAVFAERMDVNFFSEAWYRGTSRGIQVTLLEILAAGLVIGCWLDRRGEERRWFWPASLGVMLLYLVYAGISVVVSEPKIFGLFEFSKMLGSILVFLAAAAYVRTKREWTLLLVALGCAVGFEGLWAVKQYFITRLDRVAGTLDHANSLSLYFCMTVPPLVAAAFAGWSRPLRWFCTVAAALGAVGLLLTFSRAGIPVLAVVVLGTIVTCASWQLTAGRIAVRTVLVLCAFALVAATWPKIEERYASATLEEEYFDPSIDGRGIYLRLAEMIAADHFFGVGLNNWSYHVSRTYGPRLGFRFVDYDYLVSIYGTSDPLLFANSYLAAPAHNLAALTLGELGVPGLVLFGLLWLRWFWMGAAFLRLPRTEPMRVLGVGLFFSVCGVFGQSLTEWIYRQTPILFTFYILLGALASLTAVRRGSRRSGLATDAADSDSTAGAPGEGTSRPAASPALRAGLAAAMLIVGASLLAMQDVESPASRLPHRSSDSVLVCEGARDSMSARGLEVCRGGGGQTRWPSPVLRGSFSTSPTNSQPGEAGTKNFAGKSESRNSKSETTKNGKGEKKQFGLRRIKLFPRSDFYFVSKFELRISNLKILCNLREISRVSD